MNKKIKQILFYTRSWEFDFHLVMAQQLQAHYPDTNWLEIRSPLRSFSSGFLIGWISRPRRIVLSLPQFRLLIYALGSLVAAWLYAVKVDGIFVTGIRPSLLVAAGFAGTVMLTGFLMRIVTWQEVMAIIKKA